jgi:hypothetical protein
LLLVTTSVKPSFRTGVKKSFWGRVGEKSFSPPMQLKVAINASGMNGYLLFFAEEVDWIFAEIGTLSNFFCLP